MADKRSQEQIDACNEVATLIADVADMFDLEKPTELMEWIRREGYMKQNYYTTEDRLGHFRYAVEKIEIGAAVADEQKMRYEIGHLRSLY